MLNIFMEFSEYSTFVKVIVSCWILFTCVVLIVILFSRPIQKENSHHESSKQLHQTAQTEHERGNDLLITNSTFRNRNEKGSGVLIIGPQNIVIKDSNIKANGNGVESDSEKTNVLLDKSNIESGKAGISIKTNSKDKK
jgi:uncharacterized membrane protein